MQNWGQDMITETLESNKSSILFLSEQVDDGRRRVNSRQNTNDNTDHCRFHVKISRTYFRKPNKLTFSSKRKTLRILILT